MKKINFIYVLTLALNIMLIGGCSEKKEQANKNSIVYNLGADPVSLDPQLATDAYSSQIVGIAFEGLYTLDEKSEPIPATAESVDISKDGLTYTFKIRKDAKWSDGKPVTAGDFEYGLKRGMAPETASQYAFQYFYIKNAENYFNGKAKAEDVGVKAIDESTLVINLEAPTPYFLGLTTGTTFFPVRKDIVEKGKDWALNVESYVGNGSFKMKSWTQKEDIIFEKNPNYWDKDKVKLDELVVKLIVEPKTYLSAFKTGEIDLIDTPPASEVDSLLKDGLAIVEPVLGTYFYVFNVSGQNVNPEVAKFIGDKRVRKALSLSINRNLLVNEITKGGEVPALAFVPKGIVATDNKEFNSKNYYTAEEDVETAKKLLAEAGYSDPSKMPKLTFTYNPAGTNEMLAQAIQDMWKKNLGVELELKQEELAVFFSTRTNHKYEIARHGFGADFNDPMSFLDLYVTGSAQNDPGYSNANYDKLIREAKVELNPEKRTALLHQAEDMLMDDAPLIPLYYYTNLVCVNPKVKGWYRSPLGQYYFKTAYKEI